VVFSILSATGSLWVENTCNEQIKRIKNCYQLTVKTQSSITVTRT